MKSAQVFPSRYRSSSKPCTKTARTFSSTTDRHRDSTTSTVRLRLRPRLASAIRQTPARLPRRVPARPGRASVYRVASTGETFPASRPGRAQEKRTVASAKSADPRKMSGDALSSAAWSPRSRPPTATGASSAPTP